MLLALSLTVSGAAAPAPEWSKPINGLVARLELSRGEPFEGVQIIKTRIFLKNVQTAASLLSIDWPHWKLTWHVEDAAGNVLAKANGPYDGESPIPQELVLPFQGELSFDITEHGAGVMPGKTFAMLDLGPENVWAIPHDGKTYSSKAASRSPSRAISRLTGTGSARSICQQWRFQPPRRPKNSDSSRTRVMGRINQPDGAPVLMLIPPNRGPGAG
jgi:hypothetical protein